MSQFGHAAYKIKSKHQSKLGLQVP